MKNLVSEGNVINVTAPYNVASGAGCLVGSLFGVSQITALSGATDVPIVITGEYTLAKTTAEAWTVGQLIYWNDTTKACTTTVATNKLIGVATRAQLAADTTGTLRLHGAQLS